MIAIEKTLVSEALIEEQFTCNLNACKGACCIEGDSGAPLEDEELGILEDEYPQYRDYLTDEGRQMIEDQGHYTIDPSNGVFKTPVLDNGACAYLTYEKGIALCGIDKAHAAGHTIFKKPVSCHLYPVRIKRLPDYDAVNYEEWDICKDACTLGASLKIPVYVFVREALIRKYGQSFYDTLHATAEYLKNRQEQDQS